MTQCGSNTTRRRSVESGTQASYRDPAQRTPSPPAGRIIASWASAPGPGGLRAIAGRFGSTRAAGESAVVSGGQIDGGPVAAGANSRRCADGPA